MSAGITLKMSALGPVYLSVWHRFRWTWAVTAAGFCSMSAAAGGKAGKATGPRAGGDGGIFEQGQCGVRPGGRWYFHSPSGWPGYGEQAVQVVVDDGLSLLE